MTNQLLLFTDGSMNPQSKIGYGAYLAIPGLNIPIDILKDHIKVKRFINTSSTKLELETLLWAFKEINPKVKKVILYTDSQNIIGLQARKERFEKNNYLSKKQKPIRNRELYKEFFTISDNLDLELFKVDGHKPSKQKDTIDTFFNLVDKASRRALRENY